MVNVTDLPLQKLLKKRSWFFLEFVAGAERVDGRKK